MIAKIIAVGANRDEALARLRRALAQTTVVVDGGTTNKAFLLELLDRPEVRSGDARHGVARPAHRHRVVRAHPPCRRRHPRRGDRRLRRGGDAGAGPLLRVPRRVDGRRRATSSASRSSCATTAGPTGWSSGSASATSYRVRIDGHALLVDVERLGRLRRRLIVGDRSFRVVASTSGTDHLVDVDGVAHRVSRDDGGVLRAPAAALVVAVNVAARRHRRRRRSGGGRRGDEDGDRHHRPDRRPGARGAGDAQRAGRRRRPAAAHRAAGAPTTSEQAVDR